MIKLNDKCLKVTNLFSITINYVVPILYVSSLIIVYHSTPQFFESIFGADKLFPQIFLNDVFMKGGNPTDWSYSGAPYYFPDLFLYSVIFLPIKQIYWVKLVYAITQFIIIIWLSSYAIKKLTNQSIQYVLPIVTLLYSLLLWVSLINGELNRFSSYLVTSSFHVGAYINALLMLFISYKFFTGDKFLRYIVLSIFVFIALLSDKLFILLSLIPITIAISLFKRKVSLKMLLIFFVLVFLSSYLALIFARLGPYNIIRTSHGSELATINSIINSIQIYYSQFYLNFGLDSLIVLLSWIAIAFSFIIVLRKESEIIERIYLLYFILAYFVVLTAPFILNVFNDLSNSRYNIQVYYLAVFIIGYICVKMIKELAPLYQKMINLVLTGFMIIIIPFKIDSIKTGFSNYLSYKPDYMVCIEEQMKNNNLKNGLADYWLSKPVMAFSNNEIKLYTVYKSSLAPYPVLSNIKWYYLDNETNKKPVFNYVLVQGETNRQYAIETVGVENIITQLSCDIYTIIKTKDFVFESNQLSFIDDLEN